MNAERLHAVILAVKNELNSLKIFAAVKRVTKAVSQTVSQNSAQNQAALGGALESLYATLAQSPSDHFSPAWRQALQEIGGDSLLGEALVARVRDIFERNKITPTLATQAMSELQASLAAFAQGIEHTQQGFNSLRIGADKLAPGECEVGMIVPREAVNGSISEFAAELKIFDHILRTFTELTTGEKASPKIRTISSSDLSVYLASAPAVAACVAHAAAKIISVYKDLLAIRKSKADLAAKGVSDENLEGITQHADSMMEKCVDETAIEIMDQYYAGDDGGRKNELRNAVRISLRQIASRVDRGFSIEVRAEPLQELPDGEDDIDDVAAARTHVATITDSARALRFIKLEGSPILRLPESLPEEDTEDGAIPDSNSEGSSG